MIVVLIVVVVAVAVGSSGGGGGGGSQEAGAQPDGATSGKKAAGIGDHVKDGMFTFTITKMRNGLSAYGDDEITQEHAQGQFVILNVTNHGDEAQLFDVTDQHLFDGRNRKYNAESGMFTENDVFLNEINPGNTVKGKIAFDMPRHRAPTRIELHDSPFSDGVTVGLRDAQCPQSPRSGTSTMRRRTMTMGTRPPPRSRPAASTCVWAPTGVRRILGAERPDQAPMAAHAVMRTGAAHPAPGRHDENRRAELPVECGDCGRESPRGEPPVLPGPWAQGALLI